MQDGFPIAITIHPDLSPRLGKAAMIAAKTEAWINFQALKAGWYADESCVLNFDFTLMTREIFDQHRSNMTTSNWTVSADENTAFFHDRNSAQTTAFIVIRARDLVAFEQVLQNRLVSVANLVVKDYGLVGLSLVS